MNDEIIIQDSITQFNLNNQYFFRIPAGKMISDFTLKVKKAKGLSVIYYVIQQNVNEYRENVEPADLFLQSHLDLSNESTNIIYKNDNFRELKGGYLGSGTKYVLFIYAVPEPEPEPQPEP